MKKLNILLIVEVFFPDNIGGAGRVAYEQSRRLVERGHSVCVIARTFNENLPKEEIIEGINVFRYKVNNKNSKTNIISNTIF